MVESHSLRPGISRIDDRKACLALAYNADTEGLMDRAHALRDASFGDIVTYSRKVFTAGVGNDLRPARIPWRG